MGGAARPEPSESEPAARVTQPANIPDPQLLDRGRLAYAWFDGVASITLNRPDIRNAQLPTTWKAMADIGSQLPAETRVVVVRGSGSSFSAGLDRSAFTGGPDSVLTVLASAPDTVADEMIAGFQRGFSWLSDPSFISLAAVQGHAIGAGFQLALACDLVIAAQDAQFCMAEVALGLVPDLGGTGALVRAVGYQRALEICATGRRVGADEAVRIGVALVSVPVDELDGAVDDLVSALVTADVEAVRAVTRLMHSVGQLSADEQLSAERREQIRRLRALAAGVNG